MWDWDTGQGQGSPPGGGASVTPTIVSSPHDVPPVARQQEPVVIPDVACLRQQFQNQQAALAQIKETLLESDADRTSKEKQLEMYTKKLAQIKNRSKASRGENSQNVPQKSRSRSKENPAMRSVNINAGSETRVPIKTKMSEFKKCLQENKLKFEERTEKGMAETKKIESIVEHLRTQVQERDVTIQALQKNMEAPANVQSTVEPLPRRRKDRPVKLSKLTQTQYLDNEENARIKELEAIHVDLEDTIKQQESIIAARTRAITLLTEDLSKKSKSALDSLEDTRTEMRQMQSKFVTTETALKSQLQEKDDRIALLEGKLADVEETNRNLVQVQHNLQESKPDIMLNDEVDPNKTRIYELETKVAQLEKELESSNKLMIKLKLEQKQKLKVANQNIEKLKKNSGDMSSINILTSNVEELQKVNSSLNEKIAELEEEKGNLQLSLLEFDQVKVAASAEINAANDAAANVNSELEKLKVALETLSMENSDLKQAIDDQNILVDHLQSRLKVSESEGLDPFPIPGDSVADQFDASNTHFQNQLQELLSEKQELLSKLQSYTDADLASTFEQVAVNASVSVTPEYIQLEADLASERDKVNRYEAKIADLEGQIASMEKITTESKQANTLKNKFRKVVSELKKVKSINSELAEQLKEKERLITDLSEKLNVAESKRKDSISSCGEADPEVAAIQQKYLCMEDQLLQLNEKYEHLRKENIELTGEKVRRMQDHESDAETLRTLSALQSVADDLEARINTLETVPTNQELQYANIVIASNDTEIFNLQNVIANKSKEFDLLKENLDSIQLENDRLQKKIQELEENCQVISQHSQGRIEEVQKHVSELSNELFSKNAELEKVSTAELKMRHELTAYKDENSALRSENNRFKDENHRLQISIDSSMMQSVQDRARIQELLAADESASRQLVEVNLKYEETEKVLQKTWQERNDLIQSREAIMQHLRQVESEMKNLMRERDEIHGRFLDVNNQLAAKAQQDMPAKHAELEAMTAKAKLLAANLKKKTQVEKELNQKLEELTSANSELHSRLSVQQNELDQLSSDRERLLQEQKSFAAKQHQMKEDEEFLMSDLDHLSDQLDNLRKEKENLIGILSSKDSQLNEINNAFIEIRNQWDLLSQEHSKTVEELSTANLQNSSLREKIENLQEKWEVEKSEKEALNNTHKKMCQKLNDIEQAFEMEQQENCMLTEQRALSLQEVAHLQQALQNLEGKVNELESEKERMAEQQVSSLQEQAQLIRTLQQSLQERIHELQCERERQEMEQTKHDDYCSQLEESHLEVKMELTSERDALKETVSELRTSLESAAKERESLVERFTLFEAQHNEECLKDLQKKNDTITAMQQTLDSMQAQYDTLQKNREESLQEINNHLTQIANLEKQVQSFDVAFNAEVQKNASLKLEIETLVEKQKLLDSEEKATKKKRSVTFTDEAGYIKELRGEVTSLHQALVESDAAVDELKAALIKEKSDHEPVAKSFNISLFSDPPKGDFLTEPSDPFSEDSLLWDDTWGAEGQLEADHILSKTNQDEKVVKMEQELKAVYSEKEAVQEELRVLQVKYSKVVRKLKEQKLQIDQLQNELKTAKMAGSSFGDLDVALLDELKAELNKAEMAKNEVAKELEIVVKEKQSLIKQIDMLNAGSDRFVELKEKQDQEAAVWQQRNADLRNQLTQLEHQLLHPPDDSVVAKENIDLKNLIEGLEWKVSELTEMVEEKDEMITSLRSSQSNEVSNNSQELAELAESSQKALQEATDKLHDSESQLTELAAENENLQSILNCMKDASKTLPDKAMTDYSLLEEIKQLKDELNLKNQQVEKITEELNQASQAAQQQKATLLELLQTKETEVELLRNKLEEVNHLFAESNAEIERLLAENLTNSNTLNETLLFRESEITQLQLKVEELQKAYADSKLEIDRLLSEDQLGRLDDLDSNTLLQADRTRYESMIKLREDEIGHLRESLENHKKMNEEIEGSNQVVEGLKKQLIEIEASKIHATEEKELELRELKAQCSELRDMLTARQPEISLQQYESLRNEYYKAIQYLEEKTDQIAKIEPLIDQKEAELLTSRQELKSTQQRLLSRESEIAHENANLESELLARDAEVRELRAERLDFEEKCRDLSATIAQLRHHINTKSQGQNNSELPSKKQEEDDLSARLQSDLDAALYTLHQRDVRCDELTFELMQLLEERDTLQLRLSNAIRENEHFRQQSVSRSPAADLEDSVNEGHLTHKISEIHNVGYIRDKSIQDDRQQRHNEQMALISRQNNSNVNVLDV